MEKVVIVTGAVEGCRLIFDLRKAMTYNPGPDRYILKPTGVRVVEVETAASISGEVHSNLFNGNDTADSSLNCYFAKDTLDGHERSLLPTFSPAHHLG